MQVRRHIEVPLDAHLIEETPAVTSAEEATHEVARLGLLAHASVSSDRWADRYEDGWEMAWKLYRHAILLVPTSGNAHNQLAVIASYSGDEVASLLHYMCALASATPFNTAHDNLVRLLGKAEARGFGARGGVEATADGTERTEALLADYCFLHALLLKRERLTVSERHRHAPRAMPRCDAELHARGAC